MVVNGSAVKATNISASGNDWKQSIDVSKGTNVTLPSILRIDNVTNLKDGVEKQIRAITTDTSSDNLDSITTDLVKVYIGEKEAKAGLVDSSKHKFSWSLSN